MIQVRNVPTKLHRALKIRAAQEGTTLSQLVLREMSELVKRPSMEAAQAIAERLSHIVIDEKPVDAVRAERESR
jgi:plasmid stability protein